MVKRVVDKKRIIRKIEGQGGGDARGAPDQNIHVCQFQN
jgi:hypothetical protein